jgi:hypothetical protein
MGIAIGNQLSSLSGPAITLFKTRDGSGMQINASRQDSRFCNSKLGSGVGSGSGCLALCC